MMKAAVALLLTLLFTAAHVKAQCSPPSGWTHSYYLCSVSPSSIAAGSAGFTLKIFGARLSGYATVRWSGATIPNAYVHHISQSEIDVAVPASYVTSTGTYPVVAVEPSPYGPTNAVNFIVSAGTGGTIVGPSAPSSPSGTTSGSTGGTTGSVLAVTTATLAGATSGVAYTTALMASGGTAPYTWSLVTNGGSLPPGLTLPASGIISGTPTATGTFSFTVQVKDSSQQTASKSLSLSVASAPSNASCTYYVSPSGSDSNSGTASAPWKTAQKAFNAAAAGQTVCFRGGTYPQTVTSGYQQTMNNSGSAGSPIVFTNYPGEIAVIQGSTKIYGSYLTFKGTPATAGHCDASSPCGLVFEGSQGYYVDNVDLMYNHDVTFDHVEIRFGNYHAGFYQEGCNNAIIGSYVHDNGSQNVNEDNGIYWSTTPGGCTNGGRIFNNLVEHNYSKGIQLYSSGSSSTPANVLVYENTSIKNGSYGAAIWGDNNVVANNIFYMNGAASGSNQVTWQTGSHQVVDHNLTWGPDSSHSGYYMAGGVCCLTNNQQADPLFINPSSLDWHLTSSSPAIGWSNSSYVLPVDKDNNPRGPGYDAGAYQH